MEQHTSPDGRLKFLVVQEEDGDVSLGFEGFPWHTHGDILAALTGLPEVEAVRRYVDNLVGGVSVVALWSVAGELQDIWVSENPEEDARYPEAGESIELRFWDGRQWPALPSGAARGRGNEVVTSMQPESPNLGFNRQRSLQELEQVDWGEPSSEWLLVRKVHCLRRKPLDQFSVEDLRLMIGQQVSLPFLVPLAIERLEPDPLVSGNLYDGDLLHAVLGVEEPFWSNHPGLFERMCAIVDEAEDLLQVTGPDPRLERMLKTFPKSPDTSGTT